MNCSCDSLFSIKDTKVHCVKIGVTLRIQSKCGKIRTKKTSNINTFSAVVNMALKIKNRNARDLFLFEK